MKMNRQHRIGKTQRANKFRERSPTSITIRELQMKKKSKHRFKPIRLANNIKYWPKYGATEIHILLVGNSIGTSTLLNNFVIPKLHPKCISHSNSSTSSDVLEKPSHIPKNIFPSAILVKGEENLTILRKGKSYSCDVLFP